MRLTNDSVYRIKTYRSDKVVLGLGIKPVMDYNPNRDSAYHSLFYTLKEGE